jgi:hypothetical protein
MGYYGHLKNMTEVWHWNYLARRLHTKEEQGAQSTRIWQKDCAPQWLLLQLWLLLLLLSN